MKVSTIKPLIVSKDTKDIIELYNALGFSEKYYRGNGDIEETEADCTILTDENNNRILISQSDVVEKEMSAIHINVDDFDETVKLFESKGYTCPTGQTKKTATSIVRMMISPKGTAVVISHHIKK